MTSSKSRSFQHPALTVDLVVLAQREGGLSVLLVKRGAHPFAGSWALPGGFVKVGEAADPSLEHAARRALQKETGLDADDVELMQIRTFDAPQRDPRMRVIITVFAALLKPEWLPFLRAGDHEHEAVFHPIQTIRSDEISLAFDHQHILHLTLERCKRELSNSDFAFSLLRHAFTVSELRSVISGLSGQVLDAANFQRRVKKLLNEGRVIKTGEYRTTSRKPAALYRFVQSDVKSNVQSNVPSNVKSKEKTS
ncbi:MAG: NUDIX hydrolase [Deltaproteobacteria bacterium]|nr:NUDIX hydrolase [Deltaproteobacteria bacterium]